MATGGTVSGNNPYTWKLSSATSLPPGLYLNETAGVIEGTPTTVGATTFEVTVTSNANKKAKAKLTLIVMKHIAITPASLPEAEAYVKYEAPYSKPLQATGGPQTPGYHWELSTGSSTPNGLSLNEQIGSLKANQPFKSQRIPSKSRVTDKAGGTATATFTLAVAPTCRSQPRAWRTPSSTTITTNS